jgi:ribokinase
MAVVVVGSYNQDMVWRTAQFPVPGETRLGEFASGPGGKGFNQAIAACRQGVETHFIGALGEDSLGREMLALAAREGLQTHCEQHALLATGTAAILVDAQAQNLIVVGPGANAALSVAHVDAQRDCLQRAARVLVTQHEVAFAASAAAQALAKAADVLCLHNPAPPVVDDIAQQLCRQADILTPNETEFAHLLRVAHGLDIDASTLSSQSDAALHAWCRAISDATVVITLGARGAFVSHADNNRRGDAVAHYRVEPCIVQAVDTTGAGDAFSGALAAALAKAPTDPFALAVMQASKVAALSTERIGAALAIPRAGEVAERFG